jgi:hypothetical protein
MKKNVFAEEPLLGKQVSKYLKEQNLKGMTAILSVLENYFYKKIYSSVRTDLHEVSPVCSYTVFPIIEKGKARFMLTIENGSITAGGFNIYGKSMKDVSKKFFAAFLKGTIKITFESYLIFYLKNANPNSGSKSLVKGRRQSCKVSFDLTYAVGKSPIISNLSVVRYKWAKTDEKIIA